MAFGDSIYGYDFTNSPAYPYRKVNTSSTSVLVDKGTQKVSRPAALSDTRKIMGPLRDTSSSSVVYTAGSNIMPSGISYYPYAQYGIYGGQYIYGVNDQKEGWAPYNPGRYFQPDSSSYYEALLNNKR
ncbi:hypothetical protein AB6A40_006994 [Gnathostoma spinigerum]|uniref:Uncharacterized protein n=1 Tax=Gnathostoma spinigerum TaxID=75299 RepID=A0ABD6EJY3_9BILA